MKTPWRERIAWHATPHDVRLAPAPPDPAEHAALREREAYERGRQDGERALGEQLLQQRNELLQLQSGVLQSLRNALPTVAQECERTLVQLALEIAGKLVANLPITAADVEANLRAAVAQLHDATEYTVLLHPEDLSLLESTDARAKLEAAPGDAVHLTPSPEVSRGGCIVRTRFGAIDATRESKLELLRQSLLA